MSDKIGPSLRASIKAKILGEAYGSSFGPPTLTPLSSKKERFISAWQDLMVQLEALWLDVLYTDEDLYEEALPILQTVRNSTPESLEMVLESFMSLYKLLEDWVAKEGAICDPEEAKILLSRMEYLIDEADYVRDQFSPSVSEIPGSPIVPKRQWMKSREEEGGDEEDGQDGDAKDVDSRDGNPEDEEDVNQEDEEGEGNEEDEEGVYDSSADDEDRDGDTESDDVDNDAQDDDKEESEGGDDESGEEEDSQGRTPSSSKRKEKSRKGKGPFGESITIGDSLNKLYESESTFDVFSNVSELCTRMTASLLEFTDCKDASWKVLSASHTPSIGASARIACQWGDNDIGYIEFETISENEIRIRSGSPRILSVDEYVDDSVLADDLYECISPDVANVTGCDLRPNGFVSTLKRLVEYGNADRSNLENLSKRITKLIEEDPSIQSVGPVSSRLCESGFTTLYYWDWYAGRQRIESELKDRQREEKTYPIKKDQHTTRDELKPKETDPQHMVRPEVLGIEPGKRGDGTERPAPSENFPDLWNTSFLGIDADGTIHVSQEGKKIVIDSQISDIDLAKLLVSGAHVVEDNFSPDWSRSFKDSL